MSGLRAFAARHDEGLRYVVALVSYVLVGAFVQKLVFNWLAGPAWALFFIWWLPSRLRRRRGQAA